ncbi:MAG: hypothetical protein J6J23_05025 [Clostridia bacterium]|nr:hypothetical protein [Clostridia bacterium]
MAEKKSSKTQTSSSNRTTTVWSLNKVSFYVICASAILYLIGAVLAMFDLQLKIVAALQGVASALTISIVAIIAWRFVSHKSNAYKVLYLVCLLVVLIGIILPLII